jgi:hypothetical protein
MTSRIVRAIGASGLSIYDQLGPSHKLFLCDAALEKLLNRSLRRLNLNYPIRTRSKILKSKVCEALGYPVPKSFQRTKPRFPGQDFDTYVQKSDNLQIWNEEISPRRRYVLIRVDQKQVVTSVRVVNGEVIARYDKTGTLTQKYQARSRNPVKQSCLAADSDTLPVLQQMAKMPGFFPIKELFRRLVQLTGANIANPGIDQERNRGAALHRAVCQCLGSTAYADHGQFPDVPEQLVEIKLQTAATIDLGLVCPDSEMPLAESPTLRHCDVRYAVFYGSPDGETVRLNHLVLTTGASFFAFFRRFEGKVTNKKLQIPLPPGFFD